MSKSRPSSKRLDAETPSLFPEPPAVLPAAPTTGEQHHFRWVAPLRYVLARTCILAAIIALFRGTRYEGFLAAGLLLWGIPVTSIVQAIRSTARRSEK